MFSTDSKTGLLVGSGGLLGPVWREALEGIGIRTLSADLDDPTAEWQLDLREPNSIEKIARELPLLDVIVLNAGVDAKLKAHSKSESLPAFDRVAWSNFFQVNVIGQAHLVELLIPKLRMNSTVIGIGSMYGLVSPRIDVYNPQGATNLFIKHPAYGASKAALVNLMRQYAVQYAGKISFNLLTLGVVEADQPEHFKGAMPQHIPANTFLDKAKLGKHLQALITSSDVNFTGQNVVVDGGYTLW